MSDFNIKLSSDFQNLAMATDAASYKVVLADVFYHMPKHPHLIQELTVQMYDKLDLNVEDLILIQAALENPDLSSHLLNYLSRQRDVDLPTEQIQHLRKKNQTKYDGMQADDVADQTIIDEIQTKVARALVKRFEYASEIGSYKKPHNFQANFSKLTTEVSIASIDMQPETRTLRKLRAFLKHWARDLEGPLHTVNVSVSDLTSQNELEEAIQSVAAGIHGIKITSRNIIGADDLKTRQVKVGAAHKLH